MSSIVPSACRPKCQLSIDSRAEVRGVDWEGEVVEAHEEGPRGSVGEGREVGGCDVEPPGGPTRGVWESLLGCMRKPSIRGGKGEPCRSPTQVSDLKGANSLGGLCLDSQ